MVGVGGSVIMCQDIYTAIQAHVYSRYVGMLRARDNIA